MDTRADLTATSARPYSKFTVYPKGPHALRTQNQTGSSYHGLMFAVRAGKDAVRITKLHTCCVGNPRKELYRVYIKHGHFLEGVIDPSKWREVASGETELPCTQNTYGEVPWPFEGIKIQAGEVMSIYVHCPYHKQVPPYCVLSKVPVHLSLCCPLCLSPFTAPSLSLSDDLSSSKSTHHLLSVAFSACTAPPFLKQGVAFRKFAKGWPGYPRVDVPTDKDKNLAVLVARYKYHPPHPPHPTHTKYHSPPTPPTLSLTLHKR